MMEKLCYPYYQQFSTWNEVWPLLWLWQLNSITWTLQKYKESYVQLCVANNYQIDGNWLSCDLPGHTTEVQLLLYWKEPKAIRKVMHEIEWNLRQHYSRNVLPDPKTRQRKKQKIGLLLLDKHWSKDCRYMETSQLAVKNCISLVCLITFPTSSMQSKNIALQEKAVNWRRKTCCDKCEQVLLWNIPSCTPDTLEDSVLKHIFNLHWLTNEKLWS